SRAHYFTLQSWVPRESNCEGVRNRKGSSTRTVALHRERCQEFFRTCKKTVQENDALLTEKRENDMLELLEVCKATVGRAEGFVYNFTTDENGKIENIAWSYGESVRSFSVFGDVVTFDTTCRSITYNMLLGVWFGIDNYGKAIFLGCALLQDESTQSFSWAIQTFVQFMRGRRPQTIVTDIDMGLRDAIANELPDTKHVICIWQILSKLSSWFSLPLGLQYEDFKSEFNILYHLDNMEDFDHQWNHLVARFGLGSDKHVALLYSYRAAWPFSYIRSYFIARTMTLEYSKSVDSFLRSILSAQTCLQSLFEQVGTAANFGYQTQRRLQYIPSKTCLPIEEHARSILAPFAFNALQHELVLSMHYVATEMDNGSFLVRHYKRMEGESLVFWIPEDEQVQCSCKEFEHSGILCRHSIRVFVMKNYFQIPEKYFPLRWRLESSIVPVDDPITQYSNDEHSQAFHSLAATLFSESLMSKERYNYVHRELTQLLENVQHMPANNDVGLNLTPDNVCES
ncbi:hypothetical protein NMG60_11003328, partial [Bertholletia excelsa]